MTVRPAHPLRVRAWLAAQREGAAVDAGAHPGEYVLTLRDPRRAGHLVTLAQCRYDRPDDVIRRVQRLREAAR